MNESSVTAAHWTTVLKRSGRMWRSWARAIRHSKTSAAHSRILIKFDDMIHYGGCEQVDKVLNVYKLMYFGHRQLQLRTTGATAFKFQCFAIATFSSLVLVLVFNYFFILMYDRLRW